MNDKPLSTKQNCDCCVADSASKNLNPVDVVKTMGQSAREVMRQKYSHYLFIPLAAVLWFGFVTIPVLAIPSNTYVLQFSLYTAADYIILSLLALIGALFFLTHVYSFKKSRESRNAGTALSGGVGGIAGFSASIFGAASCPMCVAALFGFLGFGTVGFLVNNQWMVFVVSALLVVVSLYFVSKKVARLNSHHHEQ